MSDPPDLIARLADTVACRAASVAVEAPDGTLRYADLDRLSNRLAHHFVALGVTRGTCVGIALPRGAAELVVMLATLKTGAAYVPLSPSHPPQRLRNIIQDAGPQLLVTQSGLALANDTACPHVVIDGLKDLPDGYPNAAPNVAADPSDLAYVMFTSGSTGRPKGVEVPRGALANFLCSMAHTPGLGPGERLLAITTTSFDISGLELLLPLWVGATSVIADLETTQDPRLLRRRLETDAITTMQATPATWRMLLDAGWTGDGKLRVLCGGEAMSTRLADRLLAAGGEVWNMYGPTETTIWSSLQRITPGYARITTGQPIDHTRIFVLDDAYAAVPIGKPGQIAIAGRGLALGYRGRPDLTAERFVEHAPGADGARVYCTGDLGRQYPDGSIEWLGRLDHQVKIRGFRVELGEIESVLRAVPGVREALVVADSPEGGDPRLLAYWVGSATRHALVAATRRSLPAYMVPAVYVPIDAFPLNTNGKIDRARLPAPGATPLPRSAQGRPQTDMEVRVANAWQQVLGIEHIPVDEDFFTLGGSSVLAVQVVALLQHALGVEVTLPSFFAAPTVRGLARNIGKGVSRHTPIVLPLRRGDPDRTPLFCLLGVALYQELALALDGDRPVIGMHVPIRYVPGHEPRPTLEQIGRRYARLIVAHQAHGPYDLLGLCFGGIVAYEVARQLEASGHEVRTVTVIDAVLPTGRRIDAGRRLRSYFGSVERAWDMPRKLQRWLQRRGGALRSRLTTWPLPSLSLGHRAAHQPVDLPIDGPEVDAEVRRFAGASKRIGSRLLIVRATAEQVPDWMQVAADHGWGGRATAVEVHDIAADHLGILRAPHVHSLARWVGERANG